MAAGAGALAARPQRHRGEPWPLPARAPYEDLSSAALYPWARAELERLDTEELKAAQAAAARGDAAAVQAFCAKVQRIFDTEHGVWASGVPQTRTA
jgi:hypothetical protein